MVSESGIRKRHPDHKSTVDTSTDESAFDEARHKVFVCVFLLAGMALLGYYGFYVNSGDNESIKDLQVKLRTCMGIISKEIGQDWRKLGVALQFNEQDLLEFQKETSFFTKTSKMLKNWQHKNDATTATLNNLIEALRSGYQMELAKKCENL